jgi:hypothetical protein
MNINYRAVHTRNPWRKVGNHKTLLSATDGMDGARNLLLRIGKVGKKWDQYGDVSCVFVWEEGANTGYAFRLLPGERHSVQKAEVPVSQLQALDMKKGGTAEEIERCFGDTSLSDQVDNPLPETLNPKIVHQPATQGEYGIWNLERPNPEELQSDKTYVEGLAHEVLVNTFERSREARNACIAHYGSSCQVCNIDFGSKYGQIGCGFIHVHHCVPIASIGEKYSVNAVADLVPVCPNCHAMLHRRDPPLSVEELRVLLNGK